MSRRNWSRQEALIVLAFYLCPPLPQKNWDDSDTEIRLLAGEIGRTESAVCLKIAYLKACDPNRTDLGFTNTTGMDRQIISKYLVNPNATMSEAIWELKQIGIRISCDGEIEASGSSRPDHPQQLGLERVEQVRTRANQDYFRSVLLSNYGCACRLTGIDIPTLPTASHIKPWAAATPSERLMSSNGLLLNALHDRAFDRDLITPDDRYRVVVSLRVPHTPTNDRWLYAFDGRKIALPGSDGSLGRASTSSTTTTNTSSNDTRENVRGSTVAEGPMTAPPRRKARYPSGRQQGIRPS
ncbi:HNH endonuclease [Thermophilibacter provencensis]|uniref:HNH endonuclease n=1 Tax=Thermophilibacter provencensis TaxID=1852386 RepID=UPI00294239C7|nr:HNH endonuclease [Thermophilibacter provencensis]